MEETDLKQLSICQHLYKLFLHGDISNLLAWSPEFPESANRRGIHQLAATCKTDTKTTVVIRRPSDCEVSLFMEDLEF